jgi:hypothetical protein
MKTKTLRQVHFCELGSGKDLKKVKGLYYYAVRGNFNDDDTIEDHAWANSIGVLVADYDILKDPEAKNERSRSKLYNHVFQDYDMIYCNDILSKVMG